MPPRYLLSLLTGLALFSLTVPPSAALAAATKPVRPNIVILLADDLGYGDLSSYGHPSITTPALDQLAAEGQRWTNFYAGAPVCSPSRGALMLGKLPVRSGLYGVKNMVFQPNAKGAIPSADRTLADALKRAGYDTAIVGKWHLGDRPDAWPTRHGFDTWLGTPYSNDQDWWVAHAKGPMWQFPLVLQQYNQAVTDNDRRSADWDTVLIRSDRSSSSYKDLVVERPARQELLTKRYTEQAVSFIKAHGESNRPFLLYVAYNMPHQPTFASEAFKGTSLAGTYGDAVQEIDWSAQQIRRALEDEGLASNTMVIFASDNGAAPAHIGGGSSGLLKGRKGTTFEGGVRSPGIFWWPGHIKPAVVHGIGSLMDLYATSLSLAGVTELPRDTDSIDLSPVLLSGRPSPRETLEYFSVTGHLLGYRKGPWKVSFTENGTDPSTQVDLYNLEQDPSELRNVASMYPDLLQGLSDEARARDAAIPRAAAIFDLD